MIQSVNVKLFHIGLERNDKMLPPGFCRPFQAYRTVIFIISHIIIITAFYSSDLFCAASRLAQRKVYGRQHCRAFIASRFPRRVTMEELARSTATASEREDGASNRKRHKQLRMQKQSPDSTAGPSAMAMSPLVARRVNRPGFNSYLKVVLDDNTIKRLHEMTLKISELVKAEVSTFAVAQGNENTLDKADDQECSKEETGYADQSKCNDSKQANSLLISPSKCSRYRLCPLLFPPSTLANVMCGVQSSFPRAVTCRSPDE